MKKIKNLIIIFPSFLSLILIIILISKNQNNNLVIEDSNRINNKNLAFMIEKSARSGQYEESSSGKWPDEGYLFNSKLSKCENGSKITYDEEFNKVKVVANKSDRCYVYFDVITIGNTCYEQNLADCFTKNYSIDNTIIYHNGTNKENDIVIDAQDESFRFSGASNIVNNYVCLDNSSEGKCNDNDLYRIIGLFKNDEGKYEAKLIKNSPYVDDSAEPKSDTIQGKGYYWSGSSTNGSNKWYNSTLNTIILNQNFLNTLPGHAQNKIIKHFYMTGSIPYSSIVDNYVYNAYQSEIVNQSSKYEGKVALMYASDYGYAAYKDGWTKYTLYGYRSIINNNWLFLGEYEWLITALSNNTTNTFNINGIGMVNSPRTVNDGIFNVRPVFYLSTDTILKSGDGSINSPFRIS